MELIGCIKTVGETTTNIRYVTTQKIENIKYHYVCEINVPEQINYIRRGIDEDFDFLGRYTAYVCNCLPTFRDSLIFTVQEIQDCSTVEDGTDRLHQNFGKTATNIRYVTTQKSEDIKYHYICEINVPEQINYIRRAIDKYFDFLGRYTAYVCNCLPTFQDSLILTVQEIQDCSTVEDGTNRLHQNRW